MVEVSMIEHAAGVVSLERFAEIDHMSHDEMGSLLLDTMAEADKLRELLDYVTPIAWYAASERERDRMRELGVEVEP